MVIGRVLQQASPKHFRDPHVARPPWLCFALPEPGSARTRFELGVVQGLVALGVPQWAARAHTGLAASQSWPGPGSARTRFELGLVLAWTRLRPNKVRARRGAGPGGPRRPARGSSGAHRFDGAAVTWRSMGWRRRVAGARACHRRCRVIRPKFTDTGTSSALVHARDRGRLGRSPPPPWFRGARPCPRAARGCPPAPARLERVRHHIGGSFW